MSGSYLDWQVGDKVVCVETWSFPTEVYGDEVGPIAGREYTIREIGMLHPTSGRVGVRLIEVVNPRRRYFTFSSWEPCFGAFRFRKVQPRKTSIAILERFLNDANAPIREEA